MVSSDSELDEGCNPRYARRNQGPMSIHVGPSYGALFSLALGTQCPLQTSTPIVQTCDQFRDEYEDEGLYLHLGLHTQTPAQAAGWACQGSKRQGKQPAAALET